jgi:hypothetical protein
LAKFHQNMQLTGVTGHRELVDADRSGLEMAVQACLAEIESRHPGSRQCLISGLAAGADQLVAKCALERGWHLHAVLASSVDSFALTMSTVDSRSLREDFLPRCEKVTIIPNDNPKEAYGYVGVSLAIANSAQSLIALWDGAASRGAGGTAETVARFLNALPQTLSLPEQAKTVYWVRTRRWGESAPPPGPAWEKVISLSHGS